ncbi:thioredoxin domain-containing protein [Spiribacter halobius]|uniref:Thioredoxin domain-containing protein n=1 Tax=Sediminicurvatus halobius TaxID=2182432 RepID=A0A2U2N1J9_9GAMM|nr:thioredoxin domain-containing protein [Spiribacter halobius]PWG62937.1 thioredoxin domain-containing protein [Spiribacter halobius]UEX77449.1 thioredoxin domain-containing protein [Spiribacter halobius]
MAEPVLERNRLADATSPYLRQHADNPVHWQPWDEPALEAARESGRPILLSIGYSACHWCHVMAHESFEDPETAAVMNRYFVNIKVDREERPDLDRIYQLAHQLLAGRPGGWPLTVFLTPDQLPFFSGTYFPRRPLQGMPAFTEVLARVHGAWQEQRAQIEDQNARLKDALRQLEGPPPGTALPGPELLQAARDHLAETFDSAFGGFGEAPKFPQPALLRRLLRHYARSVRHGQPDREALHMACHSLRRMALGGLYDQVGGGFARYSTDAYWMIPHFEKMLSDNALLLATVTDAWRATGDGFYRRIAEETAEWVRREMTLPEGGFATALDADSEGGEGAFYLWTPDQVREVLPREQAELVILRFGLDERPNFEGRWHLHVHMSFSELAKRLQRPREELVASWAEARQALLAARDARPRPARDDKALTAWNALMIRGLARAGRFLERPALVDAAEAAEGFLRENLWRDGRLLASWRGGTATLPAYLDDHAFLLAALLELQQTRWSDARLAWARELAELLLARFEDADHGGFRFTADDHEALIQRPRPFADDALPAGNAVAAQALGRLGHLLAEPRYLEAAERTVRAGAVAMGEQPAGHCALMDALEEQLEPPELVVLRPDGDPAPWREIADAGYQPQRMVFAPGAGAAIGPVPASGHGAWVCRGTHCLPPAASPTELADRLADRV